MRGAVERGLFLLRRASQQPRAHHRRQRQRHGSRDEDGDAESDCEFAEESSHHIAHKEQWNQYGDERDRQGQDGEADLLGAFERGLERSLALFDVARDVFDHDDRVVHDKTRRNREGHESEVVQAESQQIHGPE